MYEPTLPTEACMASEMLHHDADIRQSGHVAFCSVVAKLEAQVEENEVHLLSCFPGRLLLLYAV